MDHIRVGFIGTGNISHWHARQLLELQETEIAAISDPSDKGRQTFLQKFQLEGIPEYADFKDMLEGEKLDAVVICSPHTLHYQQASDAIHRGLHVLIEKPMTCTSDEARRLLALADSCGKVLQVSYQRHFQPEFLFIKQAIEAGAIGKLTSITASLYQEWAQLTEGTWRQEPKLSGGGMLMDSGSHILDVLLWTTGLTPLEVQSKLHSQNRPVEIDSYTTIRFNEGAVAGVNIIGLAPCWHETYMYCGESGAIFYENGKVSIRRYRRDPEYPQLPERTTNQDKSFIDAIMGRHEVLVPGAFALKVVELTESIYKAGGYSPA